MKKFQVFKQRKTLKLKDIIPYCYDTTKVYYEHNKFFLTHREIPFKIYIDEEYKKYLDRRVYCLTQSEEEDDYSIQIYLCT